jgi:subtilase family serine protease
MANSYDYTTLHNMGDEGQGKTIAIIDSFGTTTIRQDLGTFDTAFGLPHMCGETGPSDPSGNCPASAPGPHFDIVCFQGCPTPAPPPPSSSTYQEAKNGWALEVSLDVEWAHATAPLANIMLVTTPTAETQGVQGLQQMMNAEQYVIDNHMADVITQSFGTTEANFGAGSLKQLGQAFSDAEANHVSVFASSGDGGTTNSYKTPVKNPSVVPYPSVEWPASDPLVTAVGGTYLCTNAETGIGVDNVNPPARCDAPNTQREIGWVDSGGGYSIIYPRPSYQDVLPPGSTFTGTSPGAPGPNSNMRGVPDVAYQASAATGVLVRLTEPYPPGSTSTGCGGANPCDSGWWVVGGTSSGSPQWAGIAAMADQMAGRDLGFLNPGLYAVADNPADYAKDFFDVTTGSNETSSIPGYTASTGWDAVTGLGTPDVANLIPDLIANTPKPLRRGGGARPPPPPPPRRPRLAAPSLRRLDPDLRAHHHGPVGREAEGLDRAGRVAGHGREDELAPPAHLRVGSRGDGDATTK